MRLHRFCRNAAMVAFGLLSLVEPALGQVAVGVADVGKASSVWLVENGSARELPCESDCVPLSWSFDGRWLLLGRPVKGGFWTVSLYDKASAVPATVSLNGALSTPSWAPDGRRFVFECSGQGLRIADVSGSDPIVSPLSATGHYPSWSPNGGRIAFGGKAPDPGVWITDDQGRHSHRIESQLDVRSLCWAPDGLSVLVTAAEKAPGAYSINIVTMDGKPARRIGDVDSPQAFWSPNGERILAHRSKSWGIYTTKDGQWSSLPFASTQPPIWETSQTIVAVTSGQPVRYTLGQKLVTQYFSEPPKGWPSGDTTALVPCKGLVLEGSYSNPFAATQPPAQGQIRVRGTVEDVDVNSDTVTLAVSSVLSSDGMELNLARPIQQTVSLTPSSKRPTANGQLPLRVTDFIQEGEVSLTVTGSRAGVPEPLPVLLGTIPELAVESSSLSLVAMASLHPLRSLEYDGVCMDTVVVPLLFPVAGKVDWSDSFLASRSGGSRRHHGQDLMAPKMRPLLASFDGTVHFNHSKAGHNTITLKSADGWSVVYMHVNNDNPGTDDGKGGDRYAFAPGLKSGDQVVRGQLLGFCGDSGNAESVSPHCHFELHDDISGGVFNACPSLKEAEHLDEPIAIDPVPETKPVEGETRWDIIVVKVDPVRSVVVGDLVSSWVDGGLKACVFPKRVYVRIQPSTTLALRSQPGQSRTFADLRERMFATVIGPVPQQDEAMGARSVGLSLSLKN